MTENDQNTANGSVTEDKCDRTESGSKIPPHSVLLDNRVLGWTFIVFVVMLSACVAVAFVHFINVSMQSPSFIEDYIKNRADVPAQLTITLEYESRTLKTMGMQIAFGFLVGLIFAGIGVLLFAAGANGALDLESKGNWLPITLTSTAPGLAVLALGGIIIAIAVSKDVSRNMSAEMDLGGFKKSTETSKKSVSSRPLDSTKAAVKEPE